MESLPGKISEMIENLEALKKARELYWRDCPARQKYRFYTPPPKDRMDDRTYGPWLRTIQPPISKIKSGLDELFSYLILNGSGNWSVDGIKFALDSFANDLRKSGVLDAIIREFKEIRRRLEIKSRQQPTETKRNATPVKPERESWLWKLYEKTLKVIVDVVLGKVWHP